MKKIDVQEALKKVKEKIPWKKIFIYGEESYLTDQFLKKISDKKNLQKFYPDSLDEFFSFTGGSLFGSSAIPVIVHGEELPKYLKKKVERERFLKKLESLDSFVIAVFSGLDYKTLRGDVFSAVVGISDVTVVSKPLPQKLKINLIKKKLSSLKDVDPEVLNLVAEKVEGDLWELKNETDKLLCYPGKLSSEVVELLISSSPKVNIFELVYALMEGNRRDFLAQTSQLLSEGVDPLQLIGLLQSQLRQFVKFVSGQAVKLNPQAARRFQAYKGKLRMKEALKLLKALDEAEFAVKSGLATGEEALKFLAFKEFT